MSDARTTTTRRTAFVSKLAATGLGVGATVAGTVVVAAVDGGLRPVDGSIAAPFLDVPEPAVTPGPIAFDPPARPVPNRPHATSRGTS